MKTPTSIVLGPLLGVESDEDFTVCVLLSLENQSDKDDIELIRDNSHIKPVLIESVANYCFFRFEFRITPPDVDTSYTYAITLSGNKLRGTYGENSFTFWVTSKSSMPKIGFASCSGFHDKYPDKNHYCSFIGWSKILSSKIDVLVLTGDQIYADQLWKVVKSARKSLRSKKYLTDDMRKEIDAFYLKLYIDSWLDPFMAKALATIPNVMTWDDHDIIDGYGSHPQDVQESDLFIGIYNIAAWYYERFQLRGRQNKSLVNPDNDYSATFTFRNFTFILPDTRSKRSRDQVLDKSGYAWLNSLNARLVTSRYRYYSDNINMNVICFVLPVPIAHRNYNTRVEQITSKVFGFFQKYLPGSIRISMDDDLVDHWDHDKHAKEQLKMLNLLFSFGVKHSPYSIIIASGDVHSAGAAAIYNGTNAMCQIISSPISNNPMSSMAKWFTERIATDKNIVGNYTITDFKKFGDSEEIMFTKRNFITVSDVKTVPTGHASRLNANLYLDPWADAPIPRTVNKFNK